VCGTLLWPQQKLDEPAKLIRTRLLGESLRECGVLVLIFAPLDILLEAKGTVIWRQLRWGSFCLSSRYIVLVFVPLIGVFLLHYGIRIEGEAELVLKELKEEGQDDISDASV
jgi:hypothetical protein